MSAHNASELRLLDTASGSSAGESVGQLAACSHARVANQNDAAKTQDESPPSATPQSGVVVLQQSVPLARAISASILKELPTATVVFDGHQQVCLVNQRAEDVLGRKEAELLGLRARELFFPLVDPLVDAPNGEEAQLSLSPTERGECVARGGSGQSIDIGYSCRRLGADRVGFLIMTFQDTSAIKQLAEERNRLLRIATLGQALPSLLHELKNPLAAISVATEVLLEEIEDEDVLEQLHAIGSEIRRMKLSFDGIGALDQPLRSHRPEAIDFACREAGAVMKHRAKNAGQFLRLDIKDMPLLPLNAAVVRALVLNFVTNSIQAGSSMSTVTLNAWFDSAAQRFELRVVDTGRGMSPETLARSSELFFSTKKSGSGIGLALCRRVVEEAGGKMEIESVPGFGTAVEVSVPTDDHRQRGRN